MGKHGDGSRVSSETPEKHGDGSNVSVELSKKWPGYPRPLLRLKDKSQWNPKYPRYLTH